MLWEAACEGAGNCDTDQLAFKAILARAFTRSRDLAASEESGILNDILQWSAQAAAAQCTGGESGTVCGSKWTTTYDGSHGVGQDLSALEVIVANLPAKPLLTSKGVGAATNSTSATGGKGGRFSNGTDSGTADSNGGAAGAACSPLFIIVAAAGLTAALSWL